MGRCPRHGVSSDATYLRLDIAWVRPRVCLVPGYGDEFPDELYVPVSITKSVMREA